jgi:hypothetical protein
MPPDIIASRAATPVDARMASCPRTRGSLRARILGKTRMPCDEIEKVC